MSKSKNVDFLVKTAVVAALYAVLTMVFSFMSYGPIQFRISEIMTLLAFISPAYIPGLVLGCIIANIVSSVSWIDIIVGSLATLVATYMISRSKNLFIATLWPAIFNGLFVGVMLFYVLKWPLLYSILGVAFGELVVVTLGGYPIFKYL